MRQQGPVWDVLKLCTVATGTDAAGGGIGFLHRLKFKYYTPVVEVDTHSSLAKFMKTRYPEGRSIELWQTYYQSVVSEAQELNLDVNVDSRKMWAPLIIKPEETSVWFTIVQSVYATGRQNTPPDPL